MTYQITDSVPLPKVGGVGAKAKYPFGEMKVGDSFLCPEAKVRSAAFAFAADHGKKFKTRTESNGTRVWRVE